MRSFVLFVSLVTLGGGLAACSRSIHVAAGSGGSSSGGQPAGGTSSGGGTGGSTGVPACEPGEAMVAIASIGDLTNELAVDDTYVYFPDGASNTLRRVPKGGGEVTVVADVDVSYQFAKLIGIDAEAIYLVTDGLTRVPKAGGAPVSLTGAVLVTSLALEGSDVAWTRGSVPSGLSLSPKTGGAAVFLFQEPDGSGSVGDVALDATRVYWVESKAGAAIGDDTRTIYAVDRTGGEPVLLAQTQLGPSGDMMIDSNGNLAADGTDVYFATIKGDIERLPKNGGATTSIAWGPPGVLSLQLQGSKIVWSAGWTQQTIIDAPKAGGATHVIATVEVPEGVVVSPIATDEACVYWFDHAAHTLMKAPL